MQLPQEFIEYATDALGEHVAQRLFAEIEKGCDSTSIRVNSHKGVTVGELDAAEGCTPVKWSGMGYYLPQRPVFTLDPLFHAGAYYVQEASSMYMELAAKAVGKHYALMHDECTGADDNCAGEFFSRQLDVLDLCAAPGGKTTHLSSLISENSLLVANEVIKSRSVVLADNVAKWGADNIVVTNSDPADFKAFEGFFDLVVVDAPCSGEGLFRKESEAIGEWSPANVNLCAQRQQRILADIWPALKSGGYLVYSTCTYNKFENDGNLEYMCNTFGAEVVSLDLSQESGIIATAKGGAQFVPGQVQGEGQFMAVLYKPVTDDRVLRPHKHKKDGKKGKGKDEQPEKGCKYLPDNYMMTLNGDLVKGYRKPLYERIRFVEENLICVLSGIAVANKKGKDYIPHADFALQGIVARMAAEGKLPDGIAAVDTDRDTALKFLAKEAILLPGAPAGYVLLVYKGLGIGFVKNLGNRTNNLLPMARRIRMQING